ncbi:alpha/beta hydrolase [Candidatus Binatia bacterium]|nr:alpha/beta hydrolase [Candidatus Binatia bacterium]
MAPLPLLLVHGGAHGAWCWQPTQALLRTRSLAVDLPPRAIRGVTTAVTPPPETARIGIADFAEAVLDEADAAGLERFVLVGHSMGGLTIAEVARRAPERVAHLVFVSCIVPPEGGTVIDTLPEGVRDMTGAALARTRAGDFSLGLGMGDDVKRAMFCNDMDDEQTRLVLARCGHECPTPFTESVTRAGIPPELPKTYVRLARDQALSPADQDTQIGSLLESPGGVLAIVDLDSGHDVMISAPARMAEILDHIALAAR